MSQLTDKQRSRLYDLALAVAQVLSESRAANVGTPETPLPEHVAGDLVKMRIGSKTSNTKRLLQYGISYGRTLGMPIASSCREHTGVFWALDNSEMEETRNQLRSRILNIADALNGIEHPDFVHWAALTKVEEK